jgi:hypothetical protein
VGLPADAQQVVQVRPGGDQQQIDVVPGGDLAGPPQAVGEQVRRDGRGARGRRCHGGQGIPASWPGECWPADAARRREHVLPRVLRRARTRSPPRTAPRSTRCAASPTWCRGWSPSGARPGWWPAWTWTGARRSGWRRCRPTRPTGCRASRTPPRPGCPRRCPTCSPRRSRCCWRCWPRPGSPPAARPATRPTT